MNTAIKLAALVTAAAIPAAGYACCRVGLEVPPRRESDYFSLPDTEQYAPYREASTRLINRTLSIPYEDIWITSYDGLRLHAKFYAAKDASSPVQIMFHGYKSAAERDFCGGLREAIEGGFNAILVDQRAHGESGGKYLTFGIKERFDCLSWINYARTRFGADVPILLYGISMGASTVLMAAGENLPDNVAGIVADCGYTSPKDIICTVLRANRFPVFPIYPLARLGARLFAGFDLEETSVPTAMKNCTVPVLFIHGEDDRFVPCEMSRENFRLCKSKTRRLFTVARAGHGMSYMINRAGYLKEVNDFLAAVLK